MDIFSKRQLSRYYNLSWLDNGEEYTEAWTLDTLLADGYDTDFCALISGLMDGDKIPTELKDTDAPVFIEATGEYYEEKEEERIRECHHLRWHDAISDEGPGYVL